MEMAPKPSNCPGPDAAALPSANRECGDQQVFTAAAGGGAAPAPEPPPPDAVPPSLAVGPGWADRVIDELDDLVYVITLDGKLVRWNAALERVLGMAGDELRGRDCLTFVPQGHRERTRAVLRRVVEQGTAEADVPVCTADGRQVLYHFKDVLVRDADGQPEAIVGIGRDLSDRLSREDAFRESERRFRAAVESMLDGFGIFTAVRREGRLVDFRIDHLNRAAILGSGLAPDRLLGAEALDQYRTADDVGMFEALRSVVETGRPLAQEASRYEGRDSDRVARQTLDVRAVKLGDGVAVVWRDVSERYRAARRERLYLQQLRALSAELASAEEHQRHVLAVELHDELAQLLAVAKMKLGGARGPAVTAEAGAALLDDVGEMVDRAIDHTRTLIGELSPPMLYDLGLEPALRGLAERVQTRHRLRVSVAVALAAEPPDDRRLLVYQAARELLGNIVKHAHANSATVEVREDEGQLVLRVADDGEGCPAGIETRPSTSGGFGLFSLRERLQWLGGRLCVKSRSKGGTVVKARIPVAAAPPAAGRRLRVLVADPQRLIRDGFKRLIESEGDLQAVAVAADGATALAEVGWLRPDVVVLSDRIDKGDPTETIRALRAHRADLMIIGVPMSGGDGEAMRDAGADLCFSPDDDIEQLMTALRAVMADEASPTAPAARAGGAADDAR